MVAQKPHSDRSDKKRTLEIQFMIGNNPWKSISPISKDMGMSEFLIIHEDIQYLWYKMSKGHLLSQAKKD